MVRVFLSSTARDLQTYRDAVYQAIQRLDGYQCVRMEDFGARSGTPEEYCREVVSQCDMFVGILGHLYGSSPKGATRSFTQLEYDAAVVCEKPRLMFVATDGVGLEVEPESEEQASAQRAFRKDVREDRVAAWSFKNPDALATLVITAIQNQAAAPEMAVVLERHRADCLATYGHVAVLGDHPVDVLDELPEVAYIPRRFELMGAAQIDMPPARTAPPDDRPGSQATDRKPRLELHETFLLERLRVQGAWILIEGEGGSGKTEFARHVAAHLARQMPAPVDQADRVPVFIELRALANGDQIHSAETLMDALAEHSGHLAAMAGKTTCFRRLATEGRIVLILDGLDEYAVASKLDVLDRALEDARRFFGLDRCPVLVTGRPSAFALTPKLRGRAQRLRYKPRGLTVPEIESCISDFFGADQGSAAAMVRALHEGRHSVRRLLGTPLFLTLACVFWRRGDEDMVVAGASELMANGLQHLLSRRLEGHVHRALENLSRLASHVCPQFDAITHEQAAAVIDEDLLALYANSSGILRGGPASGYRFMLRPLAEYLAGRHLARGADADVLVVVDRHAWSNRWREPLFWMAGDLWKNSREGTALALLDRLLAQVETGYDDLSETLFQRISDIVSTCGQRRLPSKFTQRLSRLLAPMTRSPNANNRLGQFADEIRAWPEGIRDAISEFVIRHAAKTYPYLVAEALGHLASERSMDTLLGLLNLKGEDDVSQNVIDALGSVGSPRAVNELIRMMEAPGTEDVHRSLCARALGKSGRSDAIPALVRYLERTEEDEYREAAYDSLASLGWTKTVSHLRALIERERPNEETDLYPRSFDWLARFAARFPEARQALERFADPDHEEDFYLQHRAAVALGHEPDVTVLLTDEIEDAAMEIAYQFAARSELAGQTVYLTKYDSEYDLGTVLADVRRVSVELDARDNAAINRYRLVRLEALDPEELLDRLELLLGFEQGEAAASVVKAMAISGSSRATGALVGQLEGHPHANVLYAAVDSLGDPSHREAIPAIRKWLDPDTSPDNDLSYHVAETLLKIDATDPEIVGACIDFELEDVVADAFRHYDYAAFGVATKLVKARFGPAEIRKAPLASAKGTSVVLVEREALTLTTLTGAAPPESSKTPRSRKRANSRTVK